MKMVRYKKDKYYVVEYEDAAYSFSGKSKETKPPKTVLTVCKIRRNTNELLDLSISWLKKNDVEKHINGIIIPINAVKKITELI